MMGMDKSTYGLMLVAIILVGGFSLFSPFGERSERLSVFHAGSLSKPFKRMEEGDGQFSLEREPSGSVRVMRKVVELGKRPDVAAVSDYSLIEDYLIPEYTRWWVQFARNEIVLAYTEESAYSGEIDGNNWFEVLGGPGVKFAFGDPNSDPGGYRAMMAVQLAELYYDNSQIFDDLIGGNTAMEAPNPNNGGYLLEAVPLEDLNPDTDKVRVGSMEVAVVPALKRGSVDYMFNYRSVATQQGFEFLELPDEINLSTIEFARNYSQVRVELSDGTVKSGKPIVYGATILENAEHEHEAIEFLRHLLGEDGRKILNDLGQRPIDSPRVNDLDGVPPGIRDLVVERED